MTGRPRPVSELTVLELGDFIAVPYAGKLLADAGAQVIKIERPDSGDTSRLFGPFPGDETDPERSGLFAYLNRGKRGVALDLRSDSGRQLLNTLAASSDVILADSDFITDLEADAPDHWVRCDASPVVTTVTPFGRSGPCRDYRATDLTISAAGGLSFGVGEADRAPLPLPGCQTEFQGGLSAAIGTMMALIARQQTGRGQVVDIALLEVIASLHTGYYLPRFIYEGGVVGRRSGRVGNITPYPNTVLPCKDGLIAMNAPQIEQWKRFIALMGEPAWSKEPRYRDRRAMQWQYKDEVDALIAPWLMEHTKAELLMMFIENRIPFAPIMTGSELLELPHLVERGAIEQYELPGGGFVAGPGNLFREQSGVRLAAPRLGEHNDDVFVGELGRAESEPADLQRQGAVKHAASPQLEPTRALGRFRVLDFGSAWAGNIAGRLLGDFGADVIKVESTTYLDGSRKGRPIISGDDASGDEGAWPDLQPGFHVIARNKRSLTLNFKHPEAADVFKRLVRVSDAVIHNFSPGVMDRMGIGKEMLLKENPRLVLVGQSLAGETGPLQDYIGYAGTVSALSGLAGLVGYDDEQPIGMFQGLYCDIVSALTSVWATAVALHDRDTHGARAPIDVSQWEATLALVPGVLMNYSLNGKDARPEGTGSRFYAPNGHYPCRGEDEWIGISTGSDDEWRALCEVLGEPGDPRFRTAEARRKHRTAVDEQLADWTRAHDAAELTRILQQRGIAAFRVQNIEGVYFDEQLAHRGTWVDVEHPLVGNEPLPGIPWTLTDTPGDVRRPAPLLAEHTREVLIELAGLTAKEIDELVNVGAVEVRA